MAKTFIEKLMSDDKGRKLYFREDLIFEITEAIYRVMEEKGVSKAELAKRAGVSKSNITQLLSGDHNMRLTTVADLLYSLDSKLEVSVAPLDLDNVLESATFNQWAPAIDLIIEEFQYQEISEDTQKKLSPAA